MDCTTLRTSDIGGRYDLSTLPLGDFWEVLGRTKHVLYDWGRDQVWVCREPFVVSYPEGQPTLADGPREEEKWLTCGGSCEWHEQLPDAFIGEWGPSSADFCLALVRSGVQVDLAGTQTYGPSDPENLLKSLKDDV
jgi:hypothetical protein